MIISASRRTDIPAYYGQWLQNRFEAGFVEVRNPYNLNQVRHVSLLSDDVDCIVFWTKNPQPFLGRLKFLEDQTYSFGFLFSLTPYGHDLEPGLPCKDEMLKIFCQLGKMVGPQRVVWRYDPVIINEVYTVKWHEDKFREYCSILSGSTEKCIISFVDIYARMEKLCQVGIICQPQVNEIIELVGSFALSAAHSGISISTCCEEYTGNAGIMPRGCIDRVWLEKIIGRTLKPDRDKNQRANCLCYPSVDIGAYDTCISGCRYCYAVRSSKLAQQRFKEHDPNKASFC